MGICKIFGLPLSILGSLIQNVSNELPLKYFNSAKFALNYYKFLILHEDIST